MKYSVIIPVYKAQDTLKRCVDSLLIQNYADAEIILVNDGSPDGCGKICEEYAEKYAQIKYIDKENGGVSSARNAGLDAANGTYILFVDSDDYVADNYFAEIDRALAEYDWDYIMFPAYYTDGETVTAGHSTPFSEIGRENAAQKIADFITDGTINGPVTKVYKRCVIQAISLRFNEKLSIAEDWSFNVIYVMNIESVCCVGKPLYFVSTENNNSLSRRIVADYYEQHKVSVADVRAGLNSCPLGSEGKKSIIRRINFMEFRAIYTRAKILHRQKMSFSQRLKTIRAMCKAVNAHKYEIPKTRKCRLISLPVKLNFALAIDIITWVLVHR